MKALLVTWDLDSVPKTVFEKLRRYIADESWARYANKAGLCQKVWFSSEEGSEFGAFYLWETQEAMEEEIRTMYRIEAITGVAPSFRRLDVEAIQEGHHEIKDLLSRGLAWEKESAKLDE